MHAKGYSTSVDWWSLGVLIFEMLVGKPPFQGDAHMNVFNRILSQKFDIPMHLSASAKHLLQSLLVVDITRRLGCLKNGVRDIKVHPFFATINWDTLYSKERKGPLETVINSEGDTHNYVKYLTESDKNPDLKVENLGAKELFSNF